MHRAPARRGFRLFFPNRSGHALRRDEILALVRVIERPESGNSLMIWLAPIDDAPFRSWHSGHLKKPYDLAHGQGVLLRSFRGVPHGAEGFCRLRKVSEAFRILRNGSDGCRRIRKISELFGNLVCHVDCSLPEGRGFSECPETVSRAYC